VWRHPSAPGDAPLRERGAVDRHRTGEEAGYGLKPGALSETFRMEIHVIMGHVSIRLVAMAPHRIVSSLAALRRRRRSRPLVFAPGRRPLGLCPPGWVLVPDLYCGQRDLFGGDRSHPRRRRY